MKNKFVLFNSYVEIQPACFLFVSLFFDIYVEIQPQCFLFVSLIFERVPWKCSPSVFCTLEDVSKNFVWLRVLCEIYPQKVALGNFETF